MRKAKQRKTTEEKKDTKVSRRKEKQRKLE